MCKSSFMYIIYKLNIGIIGLSVVCGIDRTVRALYLRLYIKSKKENIIYLIYIINK